MYALSLFRKIIELHIKVFRSEMSYLNLSKIFKQITDEAIMETHFTVLSTIY